MKKNNLNKFITQITEKFKEEKRNFNKNIEEKNWKEENINEIVD